MSEETSGAIERADECLDVLDRVIRDLDADAPGVNGDLNSPKASPKFGRDGVPTQVHSAVDAAIGAIMSVLTTAKPRLQPRLSKGPPEWWHDALELLGLQAEKSGGTDKLLDTASIFEPYLGEDAAASLIPFIFIASNTDPELRIDRSRGGFRHAGEPHPEQITVVFDPQIDQDTHRALNKTCGKVLVFSEPCGELLREALGEIQMLVE